MKENLFELQRMERLLDEIEIKAQRVLGDLKAIRDLYIDQSFPTADELGELGNEAASLGRCLRLAKDTYASDGFPEPNDLDALSQSANELASNFKRAAERNKSVIAKT
jgi:hypothetical protein